MSKTDNMIKRAIYSILLILITSLQVMGLPYCDVRKFSIIDVLELKLSNNGGISAAESQIKEKSYTEPFKADKRKVIALAVELNETGTGTF